MSWYLACMVRPAQTARSERTREALRQAALVRFLAQGVEDTSAEQIAADAGVSLRTFYRHFSSKHDLLFADYTGLHWFRSALDARPATEPIIDSVQAAIFSFPYDVDAVTKIAALRQDELDPGRIVRHIREVQADFADAIGAQLQRRSRGSTAARIRRRTNGCAPRSPRDALRPRCLARWRSGWSATTGPRRTRTAVSRGAGVAAGGNHRLLDHCGKPRSFVIIDKTFPSCQPPFRRARHD